ncbi:hypothetical protein H696_02946 [Fonticula alba]|uniref:Uncharacterized protein n=1 Tax=Fonticula alba TaxID=691883 RepID=A0A058Z9J9_FONAL|nr:hypothetical protein H696_02946 [Fonticula alba]KCV70588.1 hypothetical protein H696_02946 [Fonticula alba]|eukprot:XP_009495104.1 hypothetical protein H696_02946 [Fonticula alba]
MSSLPGTKYLLLVLGLLVTTLVLSSRDEPGAAVRLVSQRIKPARLAGDGPGLAVSRLAGAPLAAGLDRGLAPELAPLRGCCAGMPLAVALGSALADGLDPAIGAPGAGAPPPETTAVRSRRRYWNALERLAAQAADEVAPGGRRLVADWARLRAALRAGVRLAPAVLVPRSRGDPFALGEVLAQWGWHLAEAEGPGGRQLRPGPQAAAFRLAGRGPWVAASPGRGSGPAADACAPLWSEWAAWLAGSPAVGLSTTLDQMASDLEAQLGQHPAQAPTHVLLVIGPDQDTAPLLRLADMPALAAGMQFVGGTAEAVAIRPRSLPRPGAHFRGNRLEAALDFGHLEEGLPAGGLILLVEARAAAVLLRELSVAGVSAEQSAGAIADTLHKRTLRTLRTMVHFVPGATAQLPEAGREANMAVLCGLARTQHPDPLAAGCRYSEPTRTLIRHMALPPLTPGPGSAGAAAGPSDLADTGPGGVSILPGVPLDALLDCPI